MSPKSQYNLLQVPSSAPTEQIRSAYKSLAMKHHPDRAPEGAAGDDMMIQLNNAYETLSDSAKRAEYDELLQQSPQFEIDNSLNWEQFITKHAIVLSISIAVIIYISTTYILPYIIASFRTSNLQRTVLADIKRQLEREATEPVAEDKLAKPSTETIKAKQSQSISNKDSIPTIPATPPIAPTQPPLTLTALPAKRVIKSGIPFETYTAPTSSSSLQQASIPPSLISSHNSDPSAQHRRGLVAAQNADYEQCVADDLRKRHKALEIKVLLSFPLSLTLTICCHSY